jgi:phage-related minor tail protein
VSDTSLVFALSTRNDTAEGMRDARETVQQESEAMAADVEQGGAGAATRFGEALKAGAAAAMVGVAALVAAGFAEALDQSRIAGRLAAQLGKTPAEAQRYGKLAGELYADAVTEDFQGAADAISAVMRAGIAPPDATNEQLKQIATQVTDLASTFELDLGQTANAVGQMLKTGLAEDGREAVDVLTRGLQEMGPRADDIADTFNEYSTIFRQLGVDATEATGLLSQGLKAGARDTDVVADALKEFVLITQAGKDETLEAFKKIGLNGKEMQKAFVEGGPAARDALDEVFDRLRAIKDPTERNTLALALFATKSEDTQKALLALDPSKAADALGEVGGAADKMGDALRDNSGTRVEAFKRSIQQNVVDFLGGTVIPAVTDFKDEFTRVFGGLWDDAGKGGEEGVDRVLKFFELLGQRLADKAVELAPKAIEALMKFGQRVADFIVANPETVLKIGVIAGAIATAAAALPALVAGALATAAVLMMVGFTKKMITTVHEKLTEWWTAFGTWVAQKASQAPAAFNALGVAIGQWFSGLWSRYVAGPVGRQWTSFITSVQALPGRSVTALSSLGTRLASTSSEAWTRFKTAAVSKAADFIGWVGRIPGRISSGVGSLKSLLYNKGRDVVTGLWNGISSLGGWLWSRVASFVSDNVVDAAKSFLHIGSPSKLMADEIGHWLPPGIAEGAEDNRRVLDDTLQGLVDPSLVTPSVTRSTGAVPLATSGASGGQTTVRVIVDGNDALTKVIRAIVVDVGGGDVQKAFGS